MPKGNMAEKLRDQIRKSHGDDAAHMAAEIPVRGSVSSGSSAIDYAIGSGMPLDHCVEVFGPEESGKSTLCLLTAAQVIDHYKGNRAVVIMDVEHKLEKEWMTKLLGPERMKSVIHVYPDWMEEVVDIYHDIVSGGDVGMVLIDSIGGAPSMASINKSAEVADYGNAKIVTRFARMAQGHAHKYECLTVGVNQLRDDMKTPGGHALITPGGRGWKHACILRLYVRRGKGKLYDLMGPNEETVQVGYQVAGRTVKNQMGGTEGREYEYWFANVDGSKYGFFGVDKAEETGRLARATGVIARSGGWYKHELFPGGQIQGEPKVTDFLRSADVDTLARFRAETFAVLQGNPFAAPSTVDEATAAMLAEDPGAKVDSQ